MLPRLHLIPRPHRLIHARGVCRLAPAQRRAIETLRPAPGAGLAVHIDPAQVKHPQGYRLVIAPTGITLVARDAAGGQYALVTLRQIMRQCGAVLPCLRIDDHPDFPNRGFMLDISRDKVPTMATLRGVVDLMVELKLNQLQLYTEHTFAYARHRTVWRHASPMTPVQVRALDAYCRRRHVELVPNQNCFGHMERWLRHQHYHPLAEAPDGCVSPWGDFRPISATLYPGHRGSLQLVRGLLDELLPNFTSGQVNVGCDETWELGQGRSKKVCQQRGKGRVYLDFVAQVYDVAQRHGKQVQFWGDIILHTPELIPELRQRMPRAIALAWGYEADHPFAREAAQFAASGVPFYVCPGTSTWQTLAGRTTNAWANLRSAAQHGRRHGAIGYLITEWGDQGHMQGGCAAWAPLAYGAAVSWGYAANRAADVSAALNHHVFRDAADVAAQGLLQLGDAYRLPGPLVRNASILAQPYYLDPDLKAPDWLTRTTPRDWRRTRRAIEQTLARLKQAKLQRPDAALIQQEWQLAGEMMLLACDAWQARLAAQDHLWAHIPAPQRRRLIAVIDQLLPRYRRVWLARNRPGGLSDSIARIERWRDALAKR